jgi:hypothetical protein
MATDAEIRSWAREQGLPAPARGSLPGHLREAYDAWHQTGNGNGQAPGPGGGEPVDAPRTPGESRPRNLRGGKPAAGRLRGLFGGKPGGKKRKARPRVGVDDLVSFLWSGLAGVLSPMPATQKMVRMQAPVAGAVLDEVVEGTLVDRMLQPFARTSAGGEAIAVLFGPPVLVGLIEQDPRRAAFLLPTLRGLLLRWSAIAGPKLAEAAEREEEFEEQHGETVDAWLDGLLSLIDPPEPAPGGQGAPAAPPGAPPVFA